MSLPVNIPATESTDHFFEWKPRWVGKIGAAGVASAEATELPIQSSVGLTNGRAYIVTVNRVNPTGNIKNPVSETETFVAKLSGTTFINAVREVEGQAQAWEADTVIEILVTAYGNTRLLEGIKEIVDVVKIEHNTDGTHSDITADSIQLGGVGASPNEFSTDGTLAGNSDLAVPTEKAVKSYVDAEITTIASSATPAPTGGKKANELYITALAAAAEIQAPSGTPANGNKLIIRIKDNGTARALTYNTIYRGVVGGLPSTTILSKTLYMGFIYNSTDSKWDFIAKAEEA